MSRLMLGLVLMLVCASVAAQDSLRADVLHAEMQRADILNSDSSMRSHELSVLRSTIRGLDRLQKDYIEPQHYEFTVMAQVTRTYESFILGSNGQSILLAPDGQTKVGPYFGWRWFFFGYTFDIKNIGFSQNGLRKEFDFSIYTSQVGVDLFYRRTGNDYKIRDVKLGYGINGQLFEDMPFAGVNVGITGVSAYYIFNHGRFSYPAAFSQSTCQKISCGSWLAGAGYTHNTLDLDHDELEKALNSRMPKGQEVKLDSGMMFRDIKYNDFMLSGGYAYNWVFAKNWLLAVSAQLALAYKTSYGKVADEKHGFDFEKVNVDAIGRFGMVYNNTRWYAGWSAIVRTNNYHTSRFTAENVFGSFNAYIGYNFMLKKKYRKRKV
ncbi:DUF4421 domain-containing protein [Prevotella sp. khp7]|uniref:DUF4421 domain-containing protein n=1 Tax=Prevotella sp. khp7 TaxID=1761885 RepID=UPI002100F906|nr:DUF4421 domain-containing protein [Prevotella sp. khp7]